VTSLGSFSLLRSFTPVRGRVTFRRAPAAATTALAARGGAAAALGVRSLERGFTLMLSDDDGTIFSATIPAGQFSATAAVRGSSTA